MPLVRVARVMRSLMLGLGQFHRRRQLRQAHDAFAGPQTLHQRRRLLTHRQRRSQNHLCVERERGDRLSVREASKPHRPAHKQRCQFRALEEARPKRRKEAVGGRLPSCNCAHVGVGGVEARRLALLPAKGAHELGARERLACRAAHPRERVLLCARRAARERAVASGERPVRGPHHEHNSCELGAEVHQEGRSEHHLDGVAQQHVEVQAQRARHSLAVVRHAGRQLPRVEPVEEFHVGPDEGREEPRAQPRDHAIVEHGEEHAAHASGERGRNGEREQEACGCGKRRRVTAGRREDECRHARGHAQLGCRRHYECDNRARVHRALLRNEPEQPRGRLAQRQLLAT
mmetsp:Transcript_6595/g.26900  ORF Transcript_6595/g.26900 Transcript_6595/m.26900 type:complete len:346 (-) Transcript_6595:121-1158(-)